MIMYKLILKLISTKARRRFWFGSDFSEPIKGCYSYTAYVIELKAFGIYWVEVNGYGIYF